jgi:hypothetical protein
MQDLNPDCEKFKNSKLSVKVEQNLRKFLVVLSMSNESRNHLVYFVHRVPAPLLSHYLKLFAPEL